MDFVSNTQDSMKSEKKNSDSFILSKGHAALAVYSVLYEKKELIKSQ